MLMNFKSNPFYIGAGATFLFTIFYFFLSMGFEGEFDGLPNLIPFFVFFIYVICYLAEKILQFFLDKSLVFKLSLLLLIAVILSIFLNLLIYKDIRFLILISPLLIVGSLVYYFSGRYINSEFIALLLSTSPLYVFLLSLGLIVL